MDLLTGTNLFDAVERVVRGRRVACAVAFWGRGAEAMIGPAGHRNVRLICNLKMGGTNPSVIARLLDMGVDVRQCDILHAKVYIGDTDAIVTSANASINGLGLEAHEATWIETGVVVPAESAITWFESLWKQSRSIERPTDLDAAALEFLRRRRDSSEVSSEQSSPPLDEVSATTLGEIIDTTSGPTNSVFYGMSVREASVTILSKAGQPLTIRQIADELELGGFKTAARRLTDSIGDMLRTPAGYRDFVVVDSKKPIRWALTRWPGYQNLARGEPPPKKVAGLGSPEHSGRTSARLSAARERGVHLGRPQVITPEKMAQAEALIAEDMSVVSIAAKLGVSKSGLYRWLKRRR